MATHWPPSAILSFGHPLFDCCGKLGNLYALCQWKAIPPKGGYLRAAPQKAASSADAL